MSLRVKLVLSLVLFTAAGLLATAVGVTSAFERSLTGRIDDQLTQAISTWANPPFHQPPPVPAGRPRPPSNFYLRALNADGFEYDVINDFGIAPQIPADLGRRPVTVSSAGGSGPRWRVLEATNPSGSTIIAARLTDHYASLRRLIILEVMVGIIVLIALALLAYWVIGQSLRPLIEVERTAAAIADGDLNRRVPERAPGTEVGRLANAFNRMVNQIQQAFAASAASESAARDSERRMRRFVADASHELRTPLTTIRGFAELYRSGAAPDPSHAMDRIERESTRMGMLVEDLLLLARLDADRPLVKEPVDLLALAADAVHDARAVAPNRTVDLRVADGLDSAEVAGDDPRLRQVIMNLVNNALTHTAPTAKVSLGVAAEPEFVVLDVTDTGAGIAEPDRIFERFYRADTSRTRESGGTGLGLSIVHAIVTAHSGTIEVTSEPAVGTTFRVRLPRWHS